MGCITKKQRFSDGTITRRGKAVCDYCKAIRHQDLAVELVKNRCECILKDCEDFANAVEVQVIREGEPSLEERSAAGALC